MTMYAGAFLIALYKEADGKLDEEKLKGLVCAAAYCPLMVKAKQGKSRGDRVCKKSGCEIIIEGCSCKKVR